MFIGAHIQMEIHFVITHMKLGECTSKHRLQCGWLTHAIFASVIQILH